MRTVNAYAAPSATEPVIPTTIERREVGAHDVRIDIRYCHARGDLRVGQPLTGR